MVANTVILLAILELFSFTEAAIAVSGGNQINGTVGDDVTIPWVYDFESDVFSVDWRFTDSTSNTVTVMTQTGMATPVVVGGFNIRHNNNGNVTLTNAFVNNTGTYTCSVSYTLASGQSAVTGTADVIISEPTGGGGETTAPTSKTTQTSSSTNQGDGPPLEIIIPVVVVVVVIIIIIVVAHVIVWLKHGKREKGANKNSEQQLKERETTNNDGPKGDPESHQMGATRKSKVGGTHVPAGNKNGTQNTEKRSPRPLPTKPGATVTPQNELSGSQQPKRKKKRRKRVPESDSAVSRQDVELQESDKLTKRPMPSIPPGPGHDAKGRGLSANFDDEYHPMANVGIPSKKAGALDPLHEDKGDQERKKKKKKKNLDNVEDGE